MALLQLQRSWGGPPLLPSMHCNRLEGVVATNTSLPAQQYYPAVLASNSTEHTLPKHKRTSAPGH